MKINQLVSIGVFVIAQISLSMPVFADSPTDETTTLSITPATLALSATGLKTTTGDDSGMPRFFTVKNKGPVTAKHVMCPTSTSPSISSISCQGCDTILSGNSCTITITPSAISNAAPGDTHAQPIRLTIEGDNTNTLNPLVNVLTYGSFYKQQGGYLFSIIETYDPGTSIGGTVAAERDVKGQDGIEYSPDGIVSPTKDTMYSGNNGAANTEGMFDTYGKGQNYSAGLCTYRNENFTDWYLPSICEMGFGGSDTNFNCSTMTSPQYVPNIQMNLLWLNSSQNFNFVNDGFYWSSTASESEDFKAWYQRLQTSGRIGQQSKKQTGVTRGVRCVRAIIN